MLSIIPLEPRAAAREEQLGNRLPYEINMFIC